MCNSARGSRPNLADPSCLRTKGTKKCRKAFCRKQQPNSGRDQRVRKEIDDLGGIAVKSPASAKLRRKSMLN
jgi:hypothetical protein